MEYESGLRAETIMKIHILEGECVLIFINLNLNNNLKDSDKKKLKTCQKI